MMEEFFSLRHINLNVAYDGAEGLARALEGAFDLVILDVMLPSLSGFDLLRQLRTAIDPQQTPRPHRPHARYALRAICPLLPLHGERRMGETTS